MRKLLLLLPPLTLGCHTITKSSPDSDTSADACGGTIYVPQSGVDTTDPVVADASFNDFGAAPTPTRVHLSWVGEPSTTMAFVWLTDTATFASEVQVGADTSYGLTTAGASFVLLNGEDFGRVHEVRVCGLTPATTYHYRVGGEGHWSDDQTFRTAPEPGSTAPFRFVVAGDSRDNEGIWGEILAAAEAFAPDFYLFSGDAIDIGSNLTEWGAWLDEGKGFIERRPMFMAHGNHEFLAQPFFGLFAQPGNEQWWSFDYANAHFVYLNDTVVTPTDIDVQATWMDQDLKASSAPWKIVDHHQPAYSSCTTHGSNTLLQTAWSPIEEQNGVVLDLTGHNHNYERSVPLRGGQETDVANGTTYVVSAGAGADLYGNDMSQSFTTAAVADNNWVLVEINAGTLMLTAYDMSGNVIDTFSATR